MEEQPSGETEARGRAVLDQGRDRGESGHLAESDPVLRARILTRCPRGGHYPTCGQGPIPRPLSCDSAGRLAPRMRTAFGLGHAPSGLRASDRVRDWAGWQSRLSASSQRWLASLGSEPSDAQAPWPPAPALPPQLLTSAASRRGLSSRALRSLPVGWGGPRTSVFSGIHRVAGRAPGGRGRGCHALPVPHPAGSTWTKPSWQSEGKSISMQRIQANSRVQCRMEKENCT
ncbi:uncharacterized protein LOC134729349 [Pan paniscus]|uniref:uncharacterized protein LOC134729349 n=1 Tax=Pan paniscus TaxID=9597 RepID=UPI003004BFA4